MCSCEEIKNIGFCFVCFVLFCFVLSLPCDLLHVERGTSAPREFGIQLHAELCTQLTADYHDHVVLGRLVLEGRLG